MDDSELMAMAGMVNELERLTHKLMETGGDIPVVEKNLKRIMSALDILKQNLNDLAPHAGKN